MRDRKGDDRLRIELEVFGVRLNALLRAAWPRVQATIGVKPPKLCHAHKFQCYQYFKNTDHTKHIKHFQFFKYLHKFKKN